MNVWYIYIYKAFAFASLITFIISLFTSGQTTIGSLITAYSTLIISIIMIILLLLTNVLKISSNFTFFQLIQKFIMLLGPFILILGTIGLLLYLIIVHSNSISLGHVSNSYYIFSNILITLFLLQIYIFSKNIGDIKFQQTGQYSSSTSGLIYILGLLSAICGLSIYTILTYFTTDG